MLQRLRPYVLADFCASLFPGNEELGRWLDVIILREVTVIDCQRETPARIDEAGEDIAAGKRRRHLRSDHLLRIRNLRRHLNPVAVLHQRQHPVLRHDEELQALSPFA